MKHHDEVRTETNFQWIDLTSAVVSYDKFLIANYLFIIGDKKKRKKGSTADPKYRNPYDDLDDTAFFKRNLETIIKIQSVWRGKLARINFKTQKMNALSAHKYFSKEDRDETITKSK